MESKTIYSESFKSLSADYDGVVVAISGTLACGTSFEVQMGLVSMVAFLNAVKFYGHMYKGVFYIKDFHAV